MFGAKAFFVCLALCLSSVSCSSHGSRLKDEYYYEHLKVPISEFVGSINAVVEVIGQVSSVLSQTLGDLSGDFRLQNAVADCLDLLDFSFDELSWSASASQNPKENGARNVGSDLRTWLSGALSNHETCLEGLGGTSNTSILNTLPSGGLNKALSMLLHLLSLVHPHRKPKPLPKPSPVVPPRHRLMNTNNHRQFPKWVKWNDRKLLESNGSVLPVDVTVALDGTGNFTRIADAIASAPDLSENRFVIYIKQGVYLENVEIDKNKWNLMMFGDGMDATVVSGNRSFVDGWTTFRSATFAVDGKGFIARDITFENTAGPEKHQAVALRSSSDLSVFYKCAIRGYQDTLYVHTMRQFYRECIITGTVDFIFGDATVVIQNCQILARLGLPKQKNTITAQGRKDPNQPTGFSIQFCNITADADLLPVLNTTHTYLGRPWKKYSRTVFLQNYMSEVVRPEGWLEWKKDALDTLFYGEFENNGPGSELGGRVNWPGFHVFNNTVEASNFTVAAFIEGDTWLPSTGVQYIASFIN